MFKLAQDRITLLIAHRLTTIRNVDCILILADGGIGEEGSPVDLLEAGGHAKGNDINCAKRRTVPLTGVGICRSLS